MKQYLRVTLLGVALALALLLTAAVVWIVSQGKTGAPQATGGKQLLGSNPALNLRFRYDSGMFKLAPYSGRAEFALRLDAVAEAGPGGFSLYGKRVGGLGRMLGKAPGPVLYDFTAQLSDSMFVDTYGLRQLGEPQYEDAELGGELALHQVLAYELPEGLEWPDYFPAAVRGAVRVEIEGWTLLTSEDLFLFYAISAHPLTAAQRLACLQVLNSLQFDAIQEQPKATDETESQERALTGDPDAAEPPQTDTRTP